MFFDVFGVGMSLDVLEFVKLIEKYVFDIMITLIGFYSALLLFL